jgi:hypothetical protein
VPPLRPDPATPEYQSSVRIIFTSSLLTTTLEKMTKKKLRSFPYQMVRRLVQKYDVRFLEGDFRECNPALLTTWN